ncbi:ABC1 FAMILY PROTEIN [Salix koriyanagi]|uniref:ABC1 FAMILY PROTEIN n=1 Tax=Salix koriyanagi TaxID=2511006 RepID=A0A9Q0W4E7_9ROSI|nr:ABC1 FAMILY PROTEIN [Salix koriyanagi]
MLNVRRAIIPSANGHCSARALARYYAALVDGGLVPPPHSSLSKPPLVLHPHILKFPSEITSKKQKGFRRFSSVMMGSFYGFGHSGLGGSTELNVPLPDEFSVLSETVPDEESSIVETYD